jgi:hypothetical protein
MLELRSQSVPLSALTKNDVLRIVSDCVSMGASQISLEDGNLTVRREVEEHELVIPSPRAEGLDPAYLLDRLDLTELEWSPTERFLVRFQAGLAEASKGDRAPRWLITADRELPFLALRLPPANTLFGISVIEYEGMPDPHKVIFVSSPTTSIDQAVSGYVIDLGV